MGRHAAPEVLDRPHVARISPDERMRPGVPLCACGAPAWSDRHT